jgi:hypothetical protein
MRVLRTALTRFLNAWILASEKLSNAAFSAAVAPDVSAVVKLTHVPFEI